MKTLVLIGTQGPAFGDRPSATRVEADYGDGSSVISHCANWPSTERADALRAVFDQLASIETDWPSGCVHPDTEVHHNSETGSVRLVCTNCWETVQRWGSDY